jgi:cytochrome c oxidase cbb3-type subunit I/II
MSMHQGGSVGGEGAMERYSYDDSVVRKFVFATLLWAVVGMAAGLFIALQLTFPKLNFGMEWLGFGRLRPLHTNAVIFAFAGNAIFAGIYYSTQRLCKTRMFSAVLSNLHFWGWQAIIVSAALTLPLGITQGKEYAELEWPIDLAIAVVWAGFFGINFFGTLARRRERHMYVALWFYIASIVTVSVLHIFNSLAVVAGPLKSYSIYAGVQDALVQWWYGHNAVAFFLTTPFLGLMYYFLPKAAEKPVFSYKLSIVHFWSLVFMYIWAGPHHLHYTSLPAWASSLGMLFSLMLWMPSWGGMINGLMTLRGAWGRVAQDPVLKFFVVGITFYGMSTFEGPMLSIKSINALSHYTDWTIGHVHGGALGWNGFIAFGMIYWLAPRLFQTDKIWSKKACEWHFWLGTLGILMYWLSMQWAGITQGLMWRAFNGEGTLAYPDFVQTVTKLFPMYMIRAAGGGLYLVGVLIGAFNVLMTWKARPAAYEVPEYESPALSATYNDPPPYRSDLTSVVDAGKTADEFVELSWHRRWERLPLRFTVWTTGAVIVASLFEWLPLFLIRSNVPSIATVTPYTALEVAGRDIYIAEGCYNCHSQMIRPIWAETVRYGEYSKAGEFIYDHPFQWGSRRIGPDLHRVGGKYSYDWHVRHFEDPRQMVAGSIMPTYAHLLKQKIDYDGLPAHLGALRLAGVPYSDAEVNGAAASAKAQAALALKDLVAQQGYDWVGDTKVVALAAYLQRLGTDISKPAAVPAADAAAATPTADAGTEKKGVTP